MTDAAMERERAKYDDVWTQPAYRVKAHGLELWETRREIFPEKIESAVDLGCGHGRLFARWCAEGIEGHGVDISSAGPDMEVMRLWGDRFHRQCLWELSLGRMFDLGVCADVMEHIPEELVARTLECIRAHCRVVVFKIANFPSSYRGHTLHPTCCPAAWWLDAIDDATGLVERLSLESRREEYLIRWSLPARASISDRRLGRASAEEPA